jgi:hypothetical protein
MAISVLFLLYRLWSIHSLMPFATEQRLLLSLLRQLETAGVVPAAAAHLDADRAAKALGETLLAEIPAFRASSNPEVLPTLARHAREHVNEIHRLFGGGTLGDFAFVKAHAVERADQRFPLEVTLHAYRCGHRVLSQWLRQAAMASAVPQPEQAVAAVADFSIEYTNAISTIAAAEYVARTRVLAEAEGDQRTELMNTLLSGYDESDGRVARLLKRAGYLEQRQTYCVALVQPVNAAEMENPERARRILAALGDALAGSTVRMLAGVRNAAVTAIVSDRRRLSGWTAPQASLAARLYPLLLTLGPAVITGLSADHPSTAFLPRALGEAATALDFASVANRVVPFASLPLRAMLVHRGADAVRATPPPWAEALGTAGHPLIETLRAIADADLNIQEAARRLGKHPNTIYARLTRIHDITGLDARHYADLTELLLAADCWQM